MSTIDRREALRRVATVLGGAVSAPTLAAVLAACERSPVPAPGATAAKSAAPYALRTLSAAQNATVVELSEIIIPETGTPGARAARVNEFIDAMLTDYYPAAERERFLAGLARVDARAQRAHRVAFAACTPEQQTAIVAELDRLAYPPAATAAARRDPAAGERNPVTRQGTVAAGRAGSSPVSASGAVAVDGASAAEDEGPTSFFRTMKELTLVGYYTSEAGSTRELRLNPMGPYDGDVPYSRIGSAWA